MTLFKSTIVLVAFGLLLAGCHGAGKAGDVPADSTAAGRPALIAQLKAIHRLLASGDKQMIAQLFAYPLPDSVGHIYSQDTTFATELARNGGYMTREMFLRHFDSISPRLQLDQYDRLFEVLNVDSLMHRDTLETEDDTASMPCIYFYRIEVLGDTIVRITYGVNAVNPNYSASAEREAGRNDSLARARDSAARTAEDSTAQDELYNEGSCEGDIFWVYRFDGRKLHLIKHDEAD